MGVSKNSGVSPQIIHGLIGFSIIFTIHFGVFSLIFGFPPTCLCALNMNIKGAHVYSVYAASISSGTSTVKKS